MRRLLVAAGVLTLIGVPVAVGAPEGFRPSPPLTVRAVSVGGAPMTVHCANTTLIYRETAQTEEGASSSGRAVRAFREIELPPRTCWPLERWLRGATVNMKVFAYTLFVLAHETGHVALDTSDELAANCFATSHYNATARAFGVKSALTLQRLRNDAPLIPTLC